MKEILEFLRARYAEDEQVARDAHVTTPLPAVWDVSQFYGVSIPAEMHIARHDPARVLAEVEAKRRIVDRHQRTVTKSMPVFDEFDSPWAEVCAECGTHRGRYHAPCLTLRLLALPYADHPDYRPEWRP